MSTYVREKVLRVPFEHIDLSYIKKAVAEKHPNKDCDDDFCWYLEDVFPDLFDYATIGKFQVAPTESQFLDLVLDYEYDADGEYGKTRALYQSEKVKYFPIFQKIDPNIDMDYVRLVEFCWYNGTEADDYYDDVNDSFYNEV